MASGLSLLTGEKNVSFWQLVFRKHIWGSQTEEKVLLDTSEKWSIWPRALPAFTGITELRHYKSCSLHHGAPLGPCPPLEIRTRVLTGSFLKDGGQKVTLSSYILSVTPCSVGMRKEVQIGWGEKFIQLTFWGYLKLSRWHLFWEGHSWCVALGSLNHDFSKKQWCRNAVQSLVSSVKTFTLLWKICFKL